MSEIIMHTFYGPDGNYADIPLSEILDRMTDEWIDSEVTGGNISELRDACRTLLEKCKESES
jgi:hypothetical protein